MSTHRSSREANEERAAIYEACSAVSRRALADPDFRQRIADETKTPQKIADETIEAALAMLNAGDTAAATAAVVEADERMRRLTTRPGRSR